MTVSGIVELECRDGEELFLFQGRITRDESSWFIFLKNSLIRLLIVATGSTVGLMVILNVTLVL